MGASSRISSVPAANTARELKAVLEAERNGAPFFVLRTHNGELQIVVLSPERVELTIGRNPATDLRLEWDGQVSALHAVVERLAGELTIADDGLSRNGSYLNGERVHGRRRLRDRDVLRFGRTAVLVRDPLVADRTATSASSKPLLAAHLSEQQRRVLVALCRPLLEDRALATAATNQEIADALHLSVAAVKLHLRALFDKLDVGDLPQNRKRLALAGRALQSGLISERDLALDTPHGTAGRQR